MAKTGARPAFLDASRGPAVRATPAANTNSYGTTCACMIPESMPQIQ